MTNALDARVLGTTFVERMTAAKHAVLTIGNERYTRHQLVTEVGTGNFRAARILSDLCKTLKLTSIKDLYLISPYELASTHGVGLTTLFVLMALFEAKGLNVRKWYGLNGTNGKGNEGVVTFDSLKTRATKREREGNRRTIEAERKAAHVQHEARAKEFLSTRTTTR